MLRTSEATSDSTGFPVLLMVFASMVVGMLTIMAFRMIMSMADTYQHNSFVQVQTAFESIAFALLLLVLEHVLACAQEIGPTQIGSLLNLAWMMTMNSVYTYLARMVNDLENHRTETVRSVGSRW